ncbi:hypothetical protein AY601_1994 [Pedobacter cryoconitis]|uniref:Beta-glucanase n=1 Tax=Pedobacter cryoconitis TaxID=188932 RepID=A0A127VCF8_9SPHI|nr:family 16 glycosylhydrolase [Pedobacter cryoconitis]AMP98900.1 hypothetical protein AY601_1994 [Pedobacter cryoconitis]
MNINLDTQFLRRAKFFFKKIKRKVILSTKHNAFGHKFDSKGKLIDAIYIINLQRQPDRLERITDELKREKVTDNITLQEFCRKIEAVDGKVLDTTNFSSEQVDAKFNLRDQYAVDPDPRLLDIIRDKEIWVTMTKEEIAVSLSHISCWRKIIEEKQPFCLILEDDIFFESFFARKMNALWKELPVDSSGLPDFDLLYLSYREVDWGAEKQSFTKHLNRPVKGLWWLSGYVLSYKGAKKLIEALPVIGPVDLWMNLQFRNLDVYSSAPSLIFQRNDLQSGNNYSILPVLSQIGIQSDKTHLELQQRKGRNPVFLLSENVGQASLMTTALSILGYRCSWDYNGNQTDTINRLLKNNEPLLFDAYIGITISTDFSLLASMYPTALFIWIGKTEDHFLSESKKIVSEYFIGVNDVLVYDRNKHLSLNDDTKSWKKLCKFLKCKIPPFPFPILESVPDYKFGKNLKSDRDIRDFSYLQHDVTPWIIPVERLSAFGVNTELYFQRNPIDSFEPVLVETFQQVDKRYWRFLEESFPSNLAEFTAGNFKINPLGGFDLVLENRPLKSRLFSSASIASQSRYQYGRFEVTMKPVKMDGVITAFFLHRNDPWQELDIEFIGNDTTKVLLNVYFNPGSNGYGWNFGVRGTPVTVDLGFDASEEFHTYSIEWEPNGIRWFVDGKLIHSRANWQPSPIPNQPMTLFVNLWPSQSEELAGAFIGQNLPVTAHILSVSIYSLS